MGSLRAGAVAVAAGVLLASACASSDHRSTAAAPTVARPTTTSIPTTPEPTTAPPATVAPVDAAAATASCPPAPARAAPREDRSRYTLKLTVDLSGNAVDGVETVVFTPDVSTDRLVFRLWANSPRPSGAGALETIGPISAPGAGAVSRSDATTATVVLSPPAPAGRPLTASLTFHLRLPGSVDDRVSRSGDQIRLGSFFPILPWEPGWGWALDPAVSGFAEASTAATADFDVTVSAPGLDVVATGEADGRGGWHASAVPDFAMSVGHFTSASATAHAPQPVAVTVGVASGIGDRPQAYLDRIVPALEDFGRRYGAYPWPAYTVVIEPGLRGGIEYPMHVMQGPGSIGRTTPHEVAHQWFYGLVENDQGRDPWLDEGLASWAEATHEGTLASFVARAVPATGRGALGQPMTFWESRQSAYYQSVYVQGVQALNALGPPGVVDCILRSYVARNAYRVARPVDLVTAAAAVVPNATATLARFGVRF